MLARLSCSLARSARSAHTMSKDAYTRSPESFQSVLDTFKKYRACAVLRTPKAEQCAPAMQAAIDGGFEIVEFTLTTPGCLDRVADFRAKYDGKVMVGCGTVMDIDDAKRAMDAGSEFLVAPVLAPDVVTWCAMHNIVIIPGCQTPTEAYNAYKAGAPVQKIFPGVAGGHMWVKAVSAALPMLTLNPTSGVDLDNAGDFLKNGASSVGLVAPLFPPDAVAGAKWDVIQANAAKVIGNVNAAMT
uniref:2-dehydro-3-deoxyphosphogluconate aldolase n=1 Tax=Calcidiscus leptoporus TaxID=127549 RepID=A0A7S0P0F2_9EUKA|mmetsp:Transcript_45720/g.106668  ORF Transcript_45720/g.106668 Transcript_45720/m.106668 type:complete len:243 (+) Transcript_45720:53-781(+)